MEVDDHNSAVITRFQVRFMRNLDEDIILLFFYFVGKLFKMQPVTLTS